LCHKTGQPTARTYSGHSGGAKSPAPLGALLQATIDL